MKLSQRGDCWTISNLILHSKKYSCQSCFSCCGSYATVLLSALCVDNDEDTIKTLTLCLHTLPIYAIPAKCHGTWIMMQTFPLKFTNSLEWDNANRYHPFCPSLTVRLGMKVHKCHILKVSSRLFAGVLWALSVILEYFYEQQDI